ncbi:hypothetical protein CRENBAI_026664 [Crenichthys baileyi]|uniref:Uncharacterized protein n=1 Tax=Crenichthys baileyi TaxID=28760 RepID=A0AAV9QZD5_9TELE
MLCGTIVWSTSILRSGQVRPYKKERECGAKDTYFKVKRAEWTAGRVGCRFVPQKAPVYCDAASGRLPQLPEVASYGYLELRISRTQITT